MKLQSIAKLYGALAVSGMICVLLGVLVFDSLIPVYIGAGMAVAAFIVQIFARCPKCGAYIRLKFSLPDECPKCGEKFKED